MKPRNLLFALTAVAVVGCASVEFNRLQEGLHSLVGRNEREAFAALGYPSGKQQFGSDVVYTWGRSHIAPMFVPQTTTTTGYVGTTPISGFTTSDQIVPMSANCTIKIIVGSNGLIKASEYDGNLAGCGAYMKRLNAYLKR
jgi:hypothetical protein